MLTDEKELLNCLRNAEATYRRIKELEEKIASKSYKITPSYGSVGSFGGGGRRTSQIETYVETMLELKDELDICKERLKVIQAVKDCGVLSEEESRLLEWLQLGGKLSDYAKDNGIYQSKVYKIRDKALKKVLDFVRVSRKCSNGRVNY